MHARSGRNPKERRSRYNRKLFFGKRFTSTNCAAERAVSIELVRTRHERQSDTIVAIFVFSYFRAFVLSCSRDRFDLIPPQFVSRPESQPREPCERRWPPG